MKPDHLKVVVALVGGEVSGNPDGSEINYLSGQTPPTESQIDAKLKELEDEYEKQAYARSRAESYDPIPEQLDQIYHDIDGWKARIKSVKDQFPKP